MLVVAVEGASDPGHAEIKVGEQAGEMPEITFRTIEVLEVLAQI